MGTRTSTLALAAALAAPAAASEFAAGRLFVSSPTAGKVCEIDPAGNVVRSFGASIGIFAPRGIAFGPNGHLYVVSASTDTIVEVDADGVKVDEHGAGLALQNPHGIAFAADGRFYVVEKNAERLALFEADGDFSKFVPLDTGSVGFEYVLLGPDGSIYLSDASIWVSRVTPGGSLVDAAAFFDIGEDLSPHGMALGPDGAIHLVENDDMIELSATLAKGSSYGFDALSPDIEGVAFGPSGNLFAADDGRVVELDPDTGEMVREIVSQIDLSDAYGIAFAPFRFRATVNGTLHRNGEKTRAFKDKQAVLSVFPGSRQTMLAFNDSANDEFDYPSVFGAPAIVCAAQPIAVAANGKEGFVSGTQVGADPAKDGIALLGIAFDCKAGTADFLKVSDAGGTLVRAGVLGSLEAKITATKLLK